MSAATNYLEEKIRKHVTGIAAYTMPATVFLALHTSNPTETGAVDECSGGGYSRQPIAFTDNGTNATNSALVRFNSVGAVTVTHSSLWDAAVGGNPLIYSALAAPQALQAGQPLELAIGDVVVGVD